MGSPQEKEGKKKAQDGQVSLMDLLELSRTRPIIVAKRRRRSTGDALHGGVLASQERGHSS
jgi:hypothetical protein